MDTELADRVVKLERSNRRWPLLFVLVLLALIVLAAYSVFHQESDEIVANSIRTKARYVVNQHGTTVGVFSGDNYQAQLQLGFRGGLILQGDDDRGMMMLKRGGVYDDVTPQRDGR